MKGKDESPSARESLGMLFKLVLPRQKVECLLILLLGLVVSFAEVATAASLVALSHLITNPDFASTQLAKLGVEWQASHARGIFYGVFGFSAIYLMKTLLFCVQLVAQHFCILRMSYRLKKSFIRKFARMDYGHYLSRSSSSGMQLITVEIDNVFSQGLLVVIFVISEVVTFVCLGAMLVYMDPALAVILSSVLTGLVFVYNSFLFPLLYRWGKALREAKTAVIRNLVMFFHAFKEILLIGKHSFLMHELELHARNVAVVDAKQATVQNFPRVTIEVFFVMLIMSAVLFMLASGVGSQEMVGILGGYLYLGFRVLPGFIRIINLIGNFKLALPQLQRVHGEFFRGIKTEDCPSIPSFTFDSCVGIKNVTYRYPDTNRDVLKSVSLDIAKGESIGIVGSTGCGKSTLIDVLLGLLQPQGGSVSIDNRHPALCVEWRRRIGYVPQIINIMDETLQDNITFGESDSEVDRNLLEDCVRQAQLASFLEVLPQGLQTMAGERGIQMSGGERQRLAVARALYRRPQVLIFDEATSALDNETEAKLMKTIYSFKHKYTIIMVAHRLSTLNSCDRVLHMEDGKLAERI